MTQVQYLKNSRFLSMVPKFGAGKIDRLYLVPIL